MPSPKPSHQSIRLPAQVGIAACSIELGTGNEMQLLPAGEFRGRDGRPHDAPRWFLDGALAQVLIDAAEARQTPYVADYEHQTLLTKQNGQPAPAAGFFKKLEWREGSGLWAVDIDWNQRAQELIAAREYRYVSPVIGYDKATGNVTQLYMAAITNNPAIDGMDDVLLSAAALHFTLPIFTTSLTMEGNMDELLEQLRWLLNLPVGSTAEDILAQLQKLTDAIKKAVPEATAAASFDLVAHVTSQSTAIASLSAATPDPAKFVGIEVMAGLQGQVASLSAELTTIKLDGAIQAALDAGKLLPAQEAWARDFGNKDFAALSAYLNSAPPIGILQGSQTNGIPPNQTQQPGALTQNQADLCAAFGVSAEDFASTLKAESQA